MKRLDVRRLAVIEPDWLPAASRDVHRALAELATRDPERFTFHGGRLEIRRPEKGRHHV